MGMGAKATGLLCIFTLAGALAVGANIPRKRSIPSLLEGPLPPYEPSLSGIPDDDKAASLEAYREQVKVRESAVAAYLEDSRRVQEANRRAGRWKAATWLLGSVSTASAVAFLVFRRSSTASK